MMKSMPDEMMMGTAVILTNGLLDRSHAKTAHGLIRGTRRFKIIGVIDPEHAGKDAGEALDGIHRGIPIYANLDEMMEKGGEKPDYAVIGVALIGGRLNAQWQSMAIDVICRDISLVNGMHMHLNLMPEFAAAAAEHQVEIIDIRKPKSFDQLHHWSGKIYDMKIPRIAVLGTDCALGKRTTSKLIQEACKGADIRAEMIYTGQTGWLQGNPYGFILDATLNDFVSGELEHAIVRCEEEAAPDLIIVEGQSALRNPMGPCGSEMILSGNIKGIVLQHAPFRALVDGAESTRCRIPSIETELELIRLYGSKVIAVTLNGQGGTLEKLAAYGSSLEDKIGIPVILPLEDGPQGMEKFLPLVKAFMADHDGLPDTAPRLAAP